MTQYLLVQNAEPPAIAMYSATRTSDEEYLVPAAALLFRVDEPVWTIRPVDGEMDHVVYDSRGALLVGVAYLETPIAALLEALTTTCRGLAFFHFDRPGDLPRAPTPAKLQESVETQLRDETSMDEIYVRWQRG